MEHATIEPYKGPATGTGPSDSPAVVVDQYKIVTVLDEHTPGVCRVSNGRIVSGIGTPHCEGCRCSWLLIPRKEPKEPLKPIPRVITVRLSPLEHEQSKEAARQLKLSLNQFCVKAICNAADAQLNPTLFD